MSLISHVTEELILEAGDITGKWDVAHIMNIDWNKVLKKKKNMNDLIHMHLRGNEPFPLFLCLSLAINLILENMSLLSLLPYMMCVIMWCMSSL